jgi:hypothetical protein
MTSGDFLSWVGAFSALVGLLHSALRFLKSALRMKDDIFEKNRGVFFVYTRIPA